MKGKLIQNDDQYKKALDGLVKLAIELEDPLLSEGIKEKKRLIYDRTASLIQYYRRGLMVQSYPGLREQYRILKWEWQDLGEPKAVEDPPKQKEEAKPEPPQQEPQQPVETAPAPSKRNMSSWLDD
ncbi:hypothetical protein JJQ72_06500 [Paenibacillus sp. F411]|uniref:Uncharacterized protein n=1 Tax=Paenibacillus algicola TaxID=2565926 RepID=A0A4P8XMJ2_9BACL|nr:MULTISPECIES: hypothetical protein [Paenibacillus]MBO2943628.1 hypothetical protein [Paenibacillus sp. F411]QCT03768.1 hypothetical protein E6C60_3057 [Paenibacillus algicola]